MKAKSLPDQSYLLSLFKYKEGRLYWKVSRSNRIKIGDEAKSFNGKHLMVRVDGQLYLIHLLIWKMFNGRDPISVDHKDNDKLNNKIENLREATDVQNRQNTTLTKANTSGVKNVSWCRFYKKWHVSIKVDKKKKFIGYFTDLKEATMKAVEARNKYHGEFANHG